MLVLEEHVRFYSLIILLLLPLGVTLGDTRGIRNNNPANLVLTPIKWEGKVKCNDKRFECFSSPYYGLRAMYKTLYSYYYKHNKRTIREIIHRWSPPHENETRKILRDVSRRVNWEPDNNIPIRSPDFLYLLGTSLIINENGEDPYSLTLHRRAIDNAFRNNNNVRKYSTSRDVEVVVNEHEGQTGTTEGSDRENKYKEQSSRESERGYKTLFQLHEENNSTIFNLRNYCIPSNSSTLLRTERNTWLDRVAEWFPLLHRWKGCATMERGNWTGNNTPTYPSSSRDIWNVFRFKYGREPLVPLYIQ